MPKERSGGKPTTRRYSPEEKAAAVRIVRALRVELGTEQGTVSRLARQLGYGVESVRSWVRQTDIDDGYAPGVSTAESARIKELEQENRELKRPNEILSERPVSSARSSTANTRAHHRAVAVGRIAAHQNRSVGAGGAECARRDRICGVCIRF